MTKVFGLTVVLLAFALCGSAQAPKKGVEGDPQKGPCDAAMTQLDLNQCYGEQFSKAEPT